MNAATSQSSKGELLAADIKSLLASTLSQSTNPSPDAAVATPVAQDASPSNEPEKISAYPENEGLMPENEPEKNLKISVCSDGNCAYDPEDSGPFAWHPRSPLDRLPPELQATILDLLEVRTYKQVQAYLARSRAGGGFGCKTSIAALHAFYYRHRTDQLDESREMLEEQADYLLAQAGDNDEKFVKAAKHLFKRRLLESTISPTAETKELRTLFAILDRLTNTELAERRVRLAEQRAIENETASESK